MIIVTGGAGLIGSAVIWRLNQAGITDILVVDHLGSTTDKWKNLAPLSFSDYLEKAEFREAMRVGKFRGAGVEGFIHLGACSSTTERDAGYLVDNNYHYTAEAAEFALQEKCRFVYASSCATYGDGSAGYDDNEDTIHRLRPLNMYGYSKQLFDLYARRRGYFRSITGCKFSNVYGPNEQHKGEMRSVALRAFEQITASGSMKLFKSYRPEYADGEQLRDFLYVKDAVKMVEFLFNTPKAVGLFNIGSGAPDTWNHLAAAAFAALNKTEKIEYVEMPEHLRGRYQYYTCACIDKLRSFGYSEKTLTLDEAVADYFHSYLLPDRHLGD